MKKTIFVLLLFLFLALPVFVLARLPDGQAQEVEINFFYSPTCPHCAKEEKFLDKLQKEYPDIVISRYFVANSENLAKLKDFYNKFNVPKQQQGLVPATFTNSRYFIGFDEGVGQDIKNCLEEVCYKNGESANIEKGISVPILGRISVENYSLPILAVVLGTLDGFNICSLGALILILGLVLALKSRKKTLIFGGAFILTTAVIYGVLIVAWYHIFAIFSPYMKLMQALIGLMGLAGGAYFLNQFLKFRKYKPSCSANGAGLIAKASTKLQNLFQNSSSSLLFLAGIFLFAALITIIEFPCSAVVPVAFAGILANANLSAFSYLLYISIFVLFYMLDEIIVFLVAFFTAKIWLASSRATIWIILAESIILFILGIYYFFNLL